MLYFKCPTCKTILANKQLAYEEEMRKICNNEKLSIEEQNRLKSELPKKLKIKRYCCTMRLMSYSNLVKLIK